MKKSIPIYLLCILLCFQLTGCWNRRELTTLAIVQAIGIDRTEEGQIGLSNQILRPSIVKGPGEQGEQGDKGVWVVTSTGETVFDAIRNAAIKADRKLYYPHNKAIILGEEAAREGVIPLLDFLSRDSELRRLTSIFIAKGKAKDIILAEHEQEKIPGQAIEFMARGSIATSKVPKRSLHDFLETLSSKTSDSVVPGINIQEKEENGEKKEVVVLDQTAVFKKDKLIGWFNEKETRGLLWILNEVKSGVIVVESPQEEETYVSLEIIRASSEITPEITDGKLSVTVRVKEEGNLAEQMSEEDLTQPETFEELEKRQAAEIEEEMKAALNKAQEWGVDIFKFGEEFHRKFPKDWPELEENWDEEFPKIEVTVEVEAQLRRSGNMTAPVKTEEVVEETET